MTDTSTSTFTLAPVRGVVAHLISLAEADAESDNLSPLRLQKLLYYCQGWSLGIRGRALFAEKLQAWQYGPVVPEVYEELAEHGKSGIGASKLQANLGYNTDQLGQRDRDFIVGVWSVYRSFSAVTLVEMCHKEEPWIEARGETPNGSQCNEYLSEETMREFFAKLAARS